MNPKKKVNNISSPQQHPDMMSEEAIFGVGTRRLSFFHSKDAAKAKCRREQEKTKSVIWIVAFTFLLFTVVVATTIIKLCLTMGPHLAELVSFIELGTTFTLFSFKNIFLVCLK